MSKKKHVFKIVQGEPLRMSDDFFGINGELSVVSFNSPENKLNFKDCKFSKMHFSELESESSSSNLKLYQPPYLGIYYIGRETAKVFGDNGYVDAFRMYSLFEEDGSVKRTFYNYSNILGDVIKLNIKEDNANGHYLERCSSSFCAKVYEPSLTPSTADIDVSKYFTENKQPLYLSTHGQISESNGGNPLFLLEKSSVLFVNNRLVYASLKSNQELEIEPLDHEYITFEEDLDRNYHKYYFSDLQGKRIETPDNIDVCLSNMMRDRNLNVEHNFMKEILSSNENLKIIIDNLSDSKLKGLATLFNNEQVQKIFSELSPNQLQILAKCLTDTQLQTLVEHLTEHQLKTLAQDLNETKLKIIVPALNEAQLEALVKDLKPDQVKDILPHLKMEQFKALTQNLSNEQFTELAQDLAEHHLTILSKQLEGDQLKALVNGLEGGKLKDLINKLDHDKLQTIAQDLTDANRIQIIIESLITNPEKLQAFANSISDQQFTDLLNKLDSDTLIKVIHNLPHEKVMSAIGNLENENQSSAIIIKMLAEHLKEDDVRQEKVVAMIKELVTRLPTPHEGGIDLDDMFGKSAEESLLYEYPHADYFGLVA
ncbi:magnesium transporter MgtE N-terminal domain-containing protein [Wolbachia endosymbiont (group E) of Neria commutata]|uniref:magnesium transporter MgtE N-terminal domain-containing protein n=1 Tax=Wolbachia endosymbiont (group E) of Neria commutata TaxID=3066149 RepID=UPI003132B5FA